MRCFNYLILPIRCFFSDFLKTKKEKKKKKKKKKKTSDVVTHLKCLGKSVKTYVIIFWNSFELPRLIEILCKSVWRFFVKAYVICTHLNYLHKSRQFNEYK